MAGRCSRGTALVHIAWLPGKDQTVTVCSFLLSLSFQPLDAHWKRELTLRRTYSTVRPHWNPVIADVRFILPFSAEQWF